MTIPIRLTACAAAGLDESIPGDPKVLRGRFVNLFDPELRVQTMVQLVPGSRLLLLDLDEAKAKRPSLLASACKARPVQRDKAHTFLIEGVGNTPAIILFSVPSEPRSVTLEGQTLHGGEYSAGDHLFWIRFTNEPRPRELVLRF